MAITKFYPKVESHQLPEGISIQPRKFTFESDDTLDSEPKYWLGNSKIFTHFENMFSIAIPPGERFFIRSVRYYEDRVTDPEHKKLIKAFILQEGLHRNAHNEFNSSLERHGVNVESETRFFEKSIEFGEKIVPARVKLAATAFAEHLTAVGAHEIMDNPRIAEIYTPATFRFWQWHATEELEHRAVAFDLLKVVKIGYVTRVLSAVGLALVMFIFGLFSFLRLMWRDPKRIDREEITNLNKAIKIMNTRSMITMLFQYFKPSFHPWDIAPPRNLDNWYETNVDNSVVL